MIQGQDCFCNKDKTLGRIRGGPDRPPFLFFERTYIFRQKEKIFPDILPGKFFGLIFIVTMGLLSLVEGLIIFKEFN